MRIVLQAGACFALGVLVALVILAGLMFAKNFAVIDAIVLSGKPMAYVALNVLPESFWANVTGSVNPVDNPNVQSFLQMCTALGQVALVIGAGLFRLSMVK